MKPNINEVLNRLEQWGLNKTKLHEIRDKIATTIQTFLYSSSKVYCETCGVIFYEGPALGVMEKTSIIMDFRYLAFRHCWDHPQHKVIVHMPFLLQKTQGLHAGLFDYSEVVDDLRTQLRLEGNSWLNHSCDENWNSETDRVLCSTCKREFNNIKEACYCCYGSKPFLPYQELGGM